MSYLGLTSPVIAPGNGTVIPAALSQGGPSWDTSGNVTLTGNITLNNGAADGAQLTLASAGYSNWNIDNYSGRFRWYYNATEYMTLDTSGNLGLGVTPSGTWKLDVAGYVKSAAAAGGLYDAVYTGTTAGSTLGQLRFNGSGSGVTAESKIIGALSAGSITSSYLGFYVTSSGSQSQAMTLDASGNLLVGTTTTYARLSIEQSATNTDTITARNTAASPYGQIINFVNADPNNTTNYVYAGYSASSSTWIYRIWSNGTVSARSDARLKKNIEPARNGYLDDLNKIEIVKYNWYNHEDDAPKELGWVAQQVETVFPGLVQTDVADDGTESKSVKLSVFTPMLIKAIQEQQTIINAQKAALDALTSRIAALEAK